MTSAAVASEEFAGLFDQASFEHCCGAAIEAIVESLTGWVKADMEQAKAGERVTSRGKSLR